MGQGGGSAPPGALTVSTQPKEIRMSFLDDAKDKASAAATEHYDQVEEYSDQGLDRASELAEERGLDADKVDQGREALDERIGE
jgi:hypothetical protein